MTTTSRRNKVKADFREKYSYATDRQVGGFWYRWINEFEIRRSSTGPANFLPWKTFPNEHDTRREWRRICNAAAENVGQASSLSTEAKETT